MSLVWSADLENGAFKPNFTNTKSLRPSDLEAETVAVITDTPPAGLSDDNVYAIYIEGAATAQHAPSVSFSTAMLEYYGTLHIYCKGPDGNVANAQPGGFTGSVGATGNYAANVYMVMAGYAEATTGTQSDGPKCFELRLNGAGNDMTLKAGCPNKDAFTGVGSVSVNTAITLDAWTQIDYHIIYSIDSQDANVVNWDITAEIRADCGNISSATGGTTQDKTVWGTSMALKKLAIGSSNADLQYYLDQMAIFDTLGGDFDSWSCNFDDIFAPPAEGGSITVAPEKLPHVITINDTEGNLSLQKKLQDNFDSIERQLLALDPDNQDNKNPHR